MILFWLIAGILTLAAAVVLAAPLFDTRKFKTEDAYALAVYRDQLSELSRDEQRGLLSPQQARAAQVEIERRILALDEGKKFLPAKPPGHHLTLAMAVILPLLGFLYLRKNSKKILHMMTDFVSDHVGLRKLASLAAAPAEAPLQIAEE